MTMKFVKTLKCSLKSSICFWQCIDILMTKFNVINKRLWGCKEIAHYFAKPIELKGDLPNRCTKISDNSIVGLELETYKRLILKELKLAQTDEVDSACVEIVIIELLPKKFSENKAYQLVILDKLKILATFIDITPESYSHNLCPNFTYSLSWKNGEILLQTDCDSNCKSYEWLAETVLPQFIKWGEENLNHNHQICKESLRLISKEKYYEKYNELKIKYGKEMVKIWPEVTDPSKFVYEDVAIATYLLLLWELEDIETVKKSFVDLGCGNGLLVYILTKEGHDGIGIDVRRRQIWEIYPKEIKLEERTIIPSDSNLFPDADWLIGNHSDELTPWIPVIAARSSYKCKFFLLPCCAYNFDGTKYQRKDSSKSQYTEYLEHIKKLCENCGFETKTDRLKIPSTKRICIIGGKKIHSEEDYFKYCVQIQHLINESSQSNLTNPSAWVEDFKPRNPVEKVRNCTQIEKSIIKSIINKITKYLLNGCHLEQKWSRGKEVELSELVKLLSDRDLQAMKAECGGLQTLLKNNQHIFQVQKGKVQIRFPKTIEEVSKTSHKGNARNIVKIKQKPCWFFEHHPQGCPLSDESCSYLHMNET